MLLVVVLAVLFIWVFIRPQDDFFKKSEPSSIQLDPFQIVWDGFILMILDLSREDREELQRNGLLIVPITKKELIEKLSSEDEAVQDKLHEILLSLSAKFKYELTTFFALEGYTHSYFLGITIEPDDDYKDFEIEESKQLTEPESPKVMVMAAGAGK